MSAKKKGLSREQATMLYQDLQKNMAKMLKNEADYYKNQGKPVPAGSKQAAAKIQKAIAPERITKPMSFKPRASFNRGTLGALTVVVAFAAAKVVFSALEFSGIASVSKVEASYLNMPSMPKMQPSTPGQFSKEELTVLTALDARRSELENRNKRLDEREQDIQKKDKEFALRVTQLREINDKLRVERERNDKKQVGQMEQLSNVYGSMNPDEAAKLMEQLDIVTSMALIERMPEKRIAQILSSMTPERALELTRMLSGRGIK